MSREVLLEDYASRGESLEEKFKTALRGRWSDGERIIAAALRREQVASLFLESTDGEKTRLGIAFLSVMAWEQYRATLLEPVERSLIGANSALFSFSKELKELRESLSGLAENRQAASKEELDELRLSFSKEFLVLRDLIESVPRSVKIPEPIPPPDLSPIQREVQALTAAQAAAEERRLAALKAREEREAHDATMKLIRKRKAEEQAQKNRERKQEKKERQKSARAAKAERKKILESGGNPYTPEEEAAFKAKLEAKGKVFHPIEERRKLKEAGASVSPKKFVRYSQKEKQDFIEKNYLKKGRRYYTPAERRAYQLLKNQTVLDPSLPAIPPEQQKETHQTRPDPEEGQPQSIWAKGKQRAQAQTKSKKQEKPVSPDPIPVQPPVQQKVPTPVRSPVQQQADLPKSGEVTPRPSSPVVAGPSFVVPAAVSVPDSIPSSSTMTMPAGHPSWAPIGSDWTVFGPWPKKNVHHEVAWGTAIPSEHPGVPTEMKYLWLATSSDAFLLSELPFDEEGQPSPKLWIEALDDL